MSILQGYSMHTSPCSICNANRGDLSPTSWPSAKACIVYNQPPVMHADQMQQAFVLLVVCVDLARLARAGYLDCDHCSTGHCKSSDSLPLLDSCLQAHCGASQPSKLGLLSMAPPVPLNNCCCTVCHRNVTAHQAPPPNLLHHNCSLQIIPTGLHRHTNV